MRAITKHRINCANCLKIVEYTYLDHDKRYCNANCYTEHSNKIARYRVEHQTEVLVMFDLADSIL